MVDVGIAVALRHLGPVVADDLIRADRIVEVPLVQHGRIAHIGERSRLGRVHGVEVEHAARHVALDRLAGLPEPAGALTEGVGIGGRIAGAEVVPCRRHAIPLGAAVGHFAIGVVAARAELADPWHGRMDQMSDFIGLADP